MKKKFPGGRAFVSAAAGLAVSAVMTALAPAAGHASGHRDAPMTSGDPQADNTDVYAFTSPDDPSSVTMVADWIPFEEPDGGPNFYPFATNTHYNIKIDNDGDGRADIVYRWTFRNEDRRGDDTFLYANGPVRNLTDPTLLFRQYFTLEEFTRQGVRTLIKDAIAAPSRTGPASMPDYGSLREQAVRPFAGGGRTYAGQAEDPFFLDLRIFDLLYGGDLKETGHDTFKGYNVNTIAFQVPKAALALNGDPARNPVIGVWSTTDRMGVRTVLDGRFVNGYHQVSRLGNPLVNEIISPAGFKDAFNRLDPSQDHTAKPLLGRVLVPEVPALIEKLYGVPAPRTPRTDLQEFFLTGISRNSGGPLQADLNSPLLNQDVNPRLVVPAEELRLNMAVPVAARPDRLGVLGGDLQGYPNGRRLTDDVADIVLQALEGAAQTGRLVPALAKGDGVDADDSAFGPSFPYVALPHTGPAG
jgi:hypothetical protein